MSMYYPPPPYEGALPGTAVPTAPLVPLAFPASALEMYMNGSTAPTAPSVSQVASPDSSPLPGALDYWKYHRLHYLTNLHQLCVTRRTGDSYHLTDTMNTILYTATIDMKTDCFCCGKSPKGPGITWQVTNQTSGLALTIHLVREVFCCSDTILTTTVKMASDSPLGVSEGEGSKFTLKNPSGDDLCYLEMEDHCCNCSALPFLIVPAGDTHDKGEIVRYNEGFLITFPRALDVPARALLTSTVIALQYHLEDVSSAI